MKRVVVLVEGQTEEALVDEVLAPAALARGVHLIPVVVITSATPTGARRGGGSWRHYDTRLHDEYPDSRFRPLVVLHEIEALVLAAIDAGWGKG